MSLSVRNSVIAATTPETRRRTRSGKDEEIRRGSSVPCAEDDDRMVFSSIRVKRLWPQMQRMP